MPKKDWKAEFKKLTYSKGVDVLKMEITPYRDWRTVVILFFTALVSSIVYNSYVFIEINRDTFFTAAPKSTGVIKFDEERLTKVVAGLDEKSALFEKVKNDGVAIVDPSL